MATCSESGSKPSSRVLYLRLPWSRWWVYSWWCSCTQREKQLHILHGASSALTQERIENQKGMRTQLRRRMRTVHAIARPTLFHHI